MALSLLKLSEPLKQWTHSFRLRLAVWAATLAGLALTLFSFSALWLIYDVQVAHIDRALRAHAERETGRPPWEFDWERVERDIATSLNLYEVIDLLLLIQDQRGTTVYRSYHWPNLLDASRFSWPYREENNDNRYRSRPITKVIAERVTGEMWRVGLATSDQSRVAVAVNLRILEKEMRGIRLAFLVATPTALLLISLGAWLFSKRALRPIEKLTIATQQVTAAGLDQRISFAGNDREFTELITVFNSMLERLENSFQQAQRFSADAAHELKTPLAILQVQLEGAIHEAEDGSPIQAALTSILDEVRRLSMISRKLLLLAQADAGQLQLQRETLLLSKILNNLIEDAHMLAPHLQITADIQPEIIIHADPALLQQILHNLLNNAIKYNIENGWIHISATQRQHQKKIDISVTNSSPGIPQEARDHIFKRFYRANHVHGQKIEGVGLGLALSREIARAHGGDLTFRVDDANNVKFICILNIPENERAR